MSTSSVEPALPRMRALFERDDDPWSYKTSDYEAAKRRVLLDSLPAPRYTNAYEPGCAIGELTAALAPRCDRLLASDALERPVALARERVAPFSHVTVEQLLTPDQWPEQSFDLIVISELAYYLAPSALARCGEAIARTLVPGGTLVACHWRHACPDRTIETPAAHALLERAAARPRVLRHETPDFLLDVWAPHPR